MVLKTDERMLVAMIKQLLSDCHSWTYKTKAEQLTVDMTNEHINKEDIRNEIYDWLSKRIGETNQESAEYTFVEPHITGGTAIVTISKEQIINFMLSTYKDNIKYDELSFKELVDDFVAIHFCTKVEVVE